MYLKEINELLTSETNNRAAVTKYNDIKREKQTKSRDKSELDVAYYNAYLDVIQTFHQSLKCSSWRILDKIEEPLEPENNRYYENLLKEEIEDYKPSLFEKVFKKDREKINSLKDRLSYERDKDNKDYYNAIENYTILRRRFDEFKSCFKGIEDKNLRAYLYWLEQLTPFSELEQYGILSKFYYEEDVLTIQLNHSNKNIIPLNEHRIVSNQVVVAKMAIDKRINIQKQIIFSATIRAAREVFEAIPVTKVVIKSYIPSIEEDILAVAFKRELFNRLNVLEEDPLTIIQMFNNISKLDII
jgi:hypothetical protein